MSESPGMTLRGGGEGGYAIRCCFWLPFAAAHMQPAPALDASAPMEDPSRMLRRPSLLALGFLLPLAACGGNVATSAPGQHDAATSPPSTKRATDAAADAAADAPAHTVVPDDASTSSPSGPPPACTIPAYLAGDAGASHGCFSARALVICQNVNGCTDQCLSPYLTMCAPDPGGGSASCSSSSGPDTKPETCADACGANEYAVTCDVTTNVPGASISPPADCHAPSGDTANPETVSYCCPCGG